MICHNRAGERRYNMKRNELVKLMEDYTPVKIGRIQIYYDKQNGTFVVEMYEYTDTAGQDMFSVADGFEDIEIAITVATRYHCDTYNYDAQQKVLRQFGK